MVLAFENFPKIFAMNNDVEKHRAWLEDYKGIIYSSAYMEKHQMKWQTEKKKYRVFDAKINMVGRKKNRLIIEFDDHNDKGKDKGKIEINLAIVK